MLAWAGGMLLFGLATLGGVVLVLAHRAEPMLRARIVQGLTNHFHARVELDSFHVTLREGLWAEGKGLRIWPPASIAGVQVPGSTAPVMPLIQLSEFRFHTPLRYKPGVPIRISVVQLKGLDVDVPQRPHFVHPTETAKKSEEAAPGRKVNGGMDLLPFQVDRVECEGAHLTIETSKPGKLPLEFAIAQLTVTKIREGGAMDFQAELTNPRPVGKIQTLGSFGPWIVDDPGESPILGDYRFENADLGGFKGIAGILNSTGHYQGTLRNLLVDGKTDTPDFRLTHFGTTMALHTNFHARVDGTNGDTWLEPVEATLGNSHFWARGRIVRRAPGADAKGGTRAGGHEISLAVNVDRGRVEDLLRLASQSGSPLLTGALTMKADLAIPPGPVHVDQRLRLKGDFALDDVQFSSQRIKDRIAELSARGLGNPKDAKKGSPADLRSSMNGNFAMADQIVTLSALEYRVPGAVIDLKGSYGVEGGKLDFVGTAKMEATVSQMVGGWKGLLLKPMDRYFQKDGAGTSFPIHINGTRESPQFGIDFNRMKVTSAQRAGDAQ